MCQETKAPVTTAAMTTTTAATATATPPQTTAPAPIRDRTRPEIAALVQQRIKERDAWLVDGLPQEKPHVSKESKEFLGDVLPQYVMNHFQLPSQDFLDEHFLVLKMDWSQLQHPPANKIQMTWLGHATCLIQMNGCAILTDPVFSKRCAPTQWSGPKRIRPPPCTIAELCQHILIDLVIISHNHYDHLDYNSVKELLYRSPATQFVVPLGLKAWFRRWISKTAMVHELDWHEHIDYGYTSVALKQTATETKGKSSTINNGSTSTSKPVSTRQSLRIMSVPVRHWSSRIGADRDKTLWCGYSLVTTTTTTTGPESSNPQKVFFPGDTAWFDELDTVVGQGYGPFDVAAIPIGAYEPRSFMKRNHINVDEAVRMKTAIRARYAVPIHWGTFPLTVEPFLEPREVLTELMNQRDDAGSFDQWLIGETKQFDISQKSSDSDNTA